MVSGLISPRIALLTLYVLRILEELLLSIWRGLRMHRHARRSFRSIPGVWLSHIQGRQNRQYRNGQRALLGRKDSKQDFIELIDSMQSLPLRGKHAHINPTD